MHARLFLLLPLLFGAFAQASDLAREQRVRERIEGDIRQGDTISLQTANHRFLAIRNAVQTPETQGAVILVHDQGEHPDWPDVIRPLRTALPAHGWETLSIQMPLAAVDALAGSYKKLIPEAGRRLAFAVDFLKQQQILNIAIIAQGMGARSTLIWLATDKPKQVRSVVAISLSADPTNSDDAVLDALSRIKVPIFDIYGSREHAAVTHTAHARRTAALRAENSDYRQLEIEGADRTFRRQSGQLTSRIRAWLHRVSGGMELKL